VRPRSFSRRRSFGGIARAGKLSGAGNPESGQGARRSIVAWKTFLRNHAQAIAAIDLCVVPTLTFERLFAFLVLSHGRRQLLWFEVTRHPTAEWLARQITEAFPWASAPAYLVRDNDGAYRHVFRSRVRAMGIRDRPISPGSPWQNCYAERLIGALHSGLAVQSQTWMRGLYQMPRYPSQTGAPRVQ
jgi:hypothetical protein